MGEDRTELWLTLAALAVEIVLLVLFSFRARQPVNPAKPRILPYTGLIIFLGLAVLVTTAHTVSVYTGKRLEAKNKMKGQQQ
jgi:hypothetical protein